MHAWGGYRSIFISVRQWEKNRKRERQRGREKEAKREMVDPTCRIARITI